MIFSLSSDENLGINFVWPYIYKYFIALICKDDFPRYIMPRYICLYLLGRGNEPTYF